jgi:hypothetical protein
MEGVLMGDFSCQQMNALADRLEAIKPSWLPISGHVCNVTFTLGEADLVIATLRAAPQPPDAVRNEIAAYLLARDEDYAVTPQMMQWARTLIGAGMSREHSGDCTHESHACNRCIAEKAIMDADAILALPQVPATDAATMDGDDYEEAKLRIRT